MQSNQSEKSLTFNAVLAFFLAISGMFSVGCSNQHFSFLYGEGTTVSQDSSGSFSFSKRNADHKIFAKSLGKVALDESESDVTSLSPDGQWFMSEIRSGQRREYFVNADSQGELTRKFTVDGIEHKLDEKAQEWIRTTLLEVLRSSAFDANARVERLLARGGVAAVLDEVKQIEGDFGRAEYIAKLLSSSRLENAEFAVCIECLNDIKSDQELIRALSTVFDTPGSPADDCVSQILSVSERIQGDFDRSEFLILAIEKWGIDNQPLAWFKSLNGIDSDYEAAKALKVAAKIHRNDATWLEGIPHQASRQIQSPYELRCVLQTVVSVADHLTKPTIESLLNAIEKIDSDYEKGVITKELAIHIAKRSP